MSRPTTAAPRLSVLLCPFDRATPLRSALESLCRQTLPSERFEVVVVDDGSSDGTREVVAAFAGRLPVRYSYQRHAGRASARNHALFLARGEIVVLLDEDLASAGLLEAHLSAHERHPEAAVGIVGQVGLGHELADDPLMSFLWRTTACGPGVARPLAGAVLDFSHFGGGRSSCRRSFLLEHGVFNPVFRSGGESVELACRLVRHGFRLVYEPRAESTRIRPVDFDGVCRRLVRRGESNLMVSRLHPDPAVLAWSGILEAGPTWQVAGPHYERLLEAGRKLDRLVRIRREESLPIEPGDLGLLHRAYLAAFRASQAKGMVEGARAQGVPIEAWS
jgi:Glycosyl transferase family 2